MTGMHRYTVFLTVDIWHKLKLRARINNRFLSGEIRAILEKELQGGNNERRDDLPDSGRIS